MLIVFVFLESKLVYYKCNFCKNIHNSYFSGFRHAVQPNIYQSDKIFVDTYIICCQMAKITSNFMFGKFHRKFPTGEYLSGGRMIF